MLKHFVVTAILVLALTCLVVRSEEERLFDSMKRSKMDRLEYWAAGRFYRPGTYGLFDIFPEYCISAIKREVRSEDFEKRNDYELSYPEVKELVLAIAKLDINSYCSNENLVAARDFLALVQQEASEFTKMTPRRVACALSWYMESIERCYWKLDPGSDDRFGTSPGFQDFEGDFSKLKCLFNINRQLAVQIPYVRVRLSANELASWGYSRTDLNLDAIQQLNAALERKRRLDAGQDPFSADELRQVLEEKNRENAIRGDEEETTLAPLVTLCEKFISEKEKKMTPIVLLSSFVDLRIFAKRGPMKETLTAATYLTCKVLSEMEHKRSGPPSANATPLGEKGGSNDE